MFADYVENDVLSIKYGCPVFTRVNRDGSVDHITIPED